MARYLIPIVVEGADAEGARSAISLGREVPDEVVYLGDPWGVPDDGEEHEYATEAVRLSIDGRGVELRKVGSPAPRWRAVEEDEGVFWAVSDEERVGPYRSHQEARRVAAEQNRLRWGEAASG